jgi:hypothetical protein
MKAKAPEKTHTERKESMVVEPSENACRTDSWVLAQRRNSMTSVERMRARSHKRWRRCRRVSRQSTTLIAPFMVECEPQTNFATKRRRGRAATLQDRRRQRVGGCGFPPCSLVALVRDFYP